MVSKDQLNQMEQYLTKTSLALRKMHIVIDNDYVFRVVEPGEKISIEEKFEAHVKLLSMDLLKAHRSLKDIVKYVLDDVIDMKKEMGSSG